MYSPFYEKVLTGNFLNSKEKKEVLKFKKKLEKRWRKIEKKIFKKIIELSKLTFDGWKEIECYLIKNFKFSFAPPVTLKVRKNLDFSIAILVHEIFHLLLLLNERNLEKLKKKFKKAVSKFFRKRTFSFFYLIPGVGNFKRNFWKRERDKNFYNV